MDFALWSLIFVIAAGVCALTLKVESNPLKGFITKKLFFVHPLLGLIGIVLGILAITS